jgi:ABC-type transport system involved in multi-copper enzyme maturation permease subunit
MRRTLAIAQNTAREAIRDKVLYSILFFAVLVLGLSLVAEEITIGDQAKVVRSVAQGAIDIFGAIIAMFLGVSLVWKELDRKTIYTVLSKPISRWQFVVGKYLGLLATLAIEVGILIVLYAVLMTLRQGFPEGVVFVSAGLLLVELALLTAWATLFSAASSPVTAAAFTLSVFVIGHLADDIWLFGNQAESESVRQVARALYWALPNFEVLSIRQEAVHHAAVPWSRVAWSALYGLGYTVAVLVGAVLVFERKDIR